MGSESELDSIELEYWNSFLLPMEFLGLRQDFIIGDVDKSRAVAFRAGVVVKRRERIGEDGLLEGNGVSTQGFKENDFLEDLEIIGDKGNRITVDSFSGSTLVSALFTDLSDDKISSSFLIEGRIGVLVRFETLDCVLSLGWLDEGGLEKLGVRFNSDEQNPLRGISLVRTDEIFFMLRLRSGVSNLL